VSSVVESASAVPDAPASDEPVLEVIGVEILDEPPPIPQDAVGSTSTDELLDIDDSSFETVSAAATDRADDAAPQGDRADPGDTILSLDDIRVEGTALSDDPESAGAGVDVSDLHVDATDMSTPSDSRAAASVLDTAIEGLEQSRSPVWSTPSIDEEHSAEVASDTIDEFSVPAASATGGDATDARANEPDVDERAAEEPVAEVFVAFEVPATEAPEAEATDTSVAELDVADFNLPETTVDEAPAPTVAESEAAGPPSELAPEFAGEATDAFAIVDASSAESPRDDDAASRDALTEETTAEFDLPVPELAESAAESDAAATAPPASLFVTETMAELYLQQGHLESALDIYTTLVEQRPGDAELAARRKAVKDRLFGAPASFDEAAEAPAATGPTIREFLAALLAARLPASPDNGYAAFGSDAAGDDVAAAASHDAAAEEYDALDAVPGSDDGAVSESMPAAAPAPRPTPTSASDTVSGSIDSLFGGAKTAEGDVAAAVALSDAFATETPEAPLLTGVPAHRATSELSLDHVFRAGPQQPEAESGSGFSFDQFFSEEMTEARPASPADPSSSGGASPDDIAQFNAWLSGLKKT
jgi:hypothetical protein